MTDPVFTLATSSWDENEIEAINRVVASGFFSMGKEVATFEKQFATFADTPYAVMVNSGSSANLLMVAALRYHSKANLQPGDEVIVPAVSWSTTYSPLYQYGLKLKFVDIDLETLNFDLDALEKAIGPKTRLIMAVNLLGNPNDYNKINAMIAGRDIYLIEDNCESLGATLGGQQTGTFGIAGSYSCFFSHHISTMEGGMVTTNDEELYHIMLSVRAHGWTRNLPETNLVTGQKSTDAFEESFRFVLPGYNLRPLEMSGAIGQEQLLKLPMIVENRRKNAVLFKDLTKEFGDVISQKEIGESSWFGFSMVVNPECNIDRSVLLNSLQKSGVECRPIVAGNFAKNKVVEKYFDYEISGNLKNAEYIDGAGLFIGNHHYPLEKEMEALRTALKGAFC
ncbi:DegT/DnrJ/EryC1/StrS family aminotransferase [Pseudohalocynthiibacter sp. F2068]|jgi:CDP-4-dehydro-6-deoxyglucose reductase, E1|uniref:DegT/DnrJ/EryC1/StrS family aminotransferase n=1 Tax=Pseudohalocynthiibacter sp. F2068 TaxID=2926418 RepID=UPI001FF2A83A|nr:DegT/DnrJ/EryC1/StrS family aminotransferase [Pseudohalocynthiibacter sp. F2068]MCK0104136.1 DegT/DnrJ/EryC1/StrS family aminotransferase [Pseudohalocynthiibacter sp. F2068]